MLTPEKSTDLLDSTMSVLQTDVSALTPQTGKGILDEWIAAVGEGENTTSLTNALESLKTQLESSPAAPDIAAALEQLADQTEKLSGTVGPEGDMATRLEALSSSLRTLAGQLANA